MPDINPADMSDQSAYLRETTRLKQRVAELEAENKRLRAGLGRIADPAAGTHDFAALVRIAQSTLAAEKAKENSDGK